MGSREVTEGRLRSALHRLLNGEPTRIKPGGKLSLNKVNREAGVGPSYIHKFKEFVQKEANPAIESFNANFDPLKRKLDLDKDERSTETEKLKKKLKKEKMLKEQYRKELDEFKLINKKLEHQNSSLMFRIYELQEEVHRNNVIKIKAQD